MVATLERLDTALTADLSATLEGFTPVERRTWATNWRPDRVAVGALGTIRFSASLYRALGCPTYVRLLVHRGRREMALVVTGEKGPDTRRVAANSRGVATFSARVALRDLGYRPPTRGSHRVTAIRVLPTDPPAVVVRLPDAGFADEEA